MFCPNCCSKLNKGKLAEGAWGCNNCDAVWFIVNTTKPGPIKRAICDNCLGEGEAFNTWGIMTTCSVCKGTGEVSV